MSESALLGANFSAAVSSAHDSGAGAQRSFFDLQQLLVRLYACIIELIK